MRISLLLLQDKTMFRFAVCALTAALVALLPGANILAADDQYLQLRSKRQQMLELRQELIEQVLELDRLGERLRQERIHLALAVQAEQQRQGYATWNQVSQSQTIVSRLKLIDRLDRYDDQVEAQVTTLKIGLEKIRFIVVEADDLLNLMGTLKGIEVQDLSRRMQQIIARFRSQRPAIAIPDQIAGHDSLQHLWAELDQ